MKEQENEKTTLGLAKEKTRSGTAREDNSHSILNKQSHWYLYCYKLGKMVANLPPRGSNFIFGSLRQPFTAQWCRTHRLWTAPCCDLILLIDHPVLLAQDAPPCLKQWGVIFLLIRASWIISANILPKCLAVMANSGRGGLRPTWPNDVMYFLSRRTGLTSYSGK